LGSAGFLLLSQYRVGPKKSGNRREETGSTRWWWVFKKCDVFKTRAAVAAPRIALVLSLLERGKKEAFHCYNTFLIGLK
jgi:hypothetical protein